MQNAIHKTLAALLGLALVLPPMTLADCSCASYQDATSSNCCESETPEDTGGGCCCGGKCGDKQQSDPSPTLCEKSNCACDLDVPSQTPINIRRAGSVAGEPVGEFAVSAETSTVCQIDFASSQLKRTTVPPSVARGRTHLLLCIWLA